MRTKFLEGEGFYLSQIEIEDIELIAKWDNDPEATYFMYRGQVPKNKQQVKDIILADLNKPSNSLFLICSEEKSVGYCGLYDIHLTARKAEFRIMIGEKEYRNKGLGSKVTRLLTEYAFDRLNLHRVWLGYTEDNPMAQKAYENAGYVYEGKLIDDIFRNGRYYNSVRMAKINSFHLEREI